MVPGCAAQTMLKNVCVADAKGLYGHLGREPKFKEPRIGIAIGEIKRSMVAANIAARLVPHSRMVVDALTAGFGDANLQPFLGLCTSGKFIIGGLETGRTHFKRDCKKVRGNGAYDDAEVVGVSD